METSALMRVLKSGGVLERRYAIHYAQRIIPSPTQPLPTIYQLRIVLRGASPLFWRRLLVPCHTFLAHLHDILQIAFA